jgi:xylitol oxidase
MDLQIRGRGNAPASTRLRPAGGTGPRLDALASPQLRNWGGTVRYGARRLLEPTSIEELQDTMRASRALRPIGTGHSFNALPDTAGDLVSVAALPSLIEPDVASSSLTVAGGLRYGDVCRQLDQAGLALANLGSLPHLSIAGACATASHGSGDRLASLAAAVSAITLIRADGELDRLDRSSTGFHGAVAALGALGVVVELTLDAEPRYMVRQVVFEDLAYPAFVGRFDELMATASSVSCFTDWHGPRFHQVWIKERLSGADSADLNPQDLARELFGARRAQRKLHPIPGFAAEACTEQLGAPGRWFERLPHFRFEVTPSAGDEIQSEYLVPRMHAVDAFLALDAIRRELAPLTYVTEIRTLAADSLWLSPAYRRDSVAFHFTWRPDWPAVRAVLPRVEAALAPYAPRPHWGKAFAMEPAAIAATYDRIDDFRSLVARFDPEGKLQNGFLRRYVLGAD